MPSGHLTVLAGQTDTEAEHIAQGANQGNNFKPPLWMNFLKRKKKSHQKGRLAAQMAHPSLLKFVLLGPLSKDNVACRQMPAPGY